MKYLCAIILLTLSLCAESNLALFCTDGRSELIDLITNKTEDYEKTKLELLIKVNEKTGRMYVNNTPMPDIYAAGAKIYFKY